MLRVALTGGIASGKSTVAQLFCALGIPVIDTDQLARNVVEPGTTGLKAIEKAFGKSVLSDDGTLDRQAMRNLVLADTKARRTLESITHPLIFELLESSIAELDDDIPYVIIEIPLLVESGKREMFDRILVIDCKEDTQRARLVDREGISGKDASKLLASQVDRESRRSIADDVIDNSDQSLENLKQRVDALDHAYRQISSTMSR